ncbi:hypothetical protein R3P38DRAFT_3045673 [Favolaschia claudopus]|uniref:Secreted protein n=1 Tax=Favolaschia claudopus TaxID=2862362 RepID=A0AAW0A761_9AGAR
MFLPPSLRPSTFLSLWIFGLISPILSASRSHTCRHYTEFDLKSFGPHRLSCKFGHKSWQGNDVSRYGTPRSTPGCNGYI